MKQHTHSIHKSIREKLNYDSDISDEDLLNDWKNKSTKVCKPCWELKYCPYGPFVEQSPLLPTTRQKSIEHQEYLKNCLDTSIIGTKHSLDDETRQLYKNIIKDAEKDPKRLGTILSGSIYFEQNFQKECLGSDENLLIKSLTTVLGPIDKYTPPYPYNFDLESFDFDITPEIQLAIDNELEKMKSALNTGIIDNTRPLDEARKKYFEEEVRKFNPDNYPDWIPESIKEMECNIFGHICPVVFVGESITETTELRKTSRYIPFKIKIRVVRRDNYTCQKCQKHLQDDEVEFDHIIPISKGGSTEEQNIRLTCFKCNRSKSNSIEF